MITASEARELVKTQEQVYEDVRDHLLKNFQTNVENLSNAGKSQFPDSISIKIPEIMELVNTELVEKGFSTEIDETGGFIMIGWGKDGLVKTEKKEDEDDK